MTLDFNNPRQPEADIDPIFCDRWSPRALGGPALSERELASLFEAARWSPSCFNEQPWLFRYAATEKDRARFCSALAAKNQLWAADAPLLIYLAAARNFSANGQPNRHATFDAGAAWMALALQARRLGLHAHAMAGFDMDKAAEVLALDPQQFEVIAAIAVGRRQPAESLPEDFQAMEKPNSRKDRASITQEG